MKETLCQHTFWPNFLIITRKIHVCGPGTEDHISVPGPVNTLVQKAREMHVATIREACEGRIPYELHLYAEVNKHRTYWGS